MAHPYIENISRRSFLEKAGLLTGGLMIAGCFPSCNPKDGKRKRNTVYDGILFEPNLFVQLTSDGHLSLLCARSEMGQGIRTSMVSLLADEMDADMEYVSIRQAQGDKKYGDQNTDGSRSIRFFFLPMRELGAAARAVIIAAAAEKWGVDPSDCFTENHHVVHRSSKKKLFFGDLAEAASAMEVPEEVTLKDPKDFKYIKTWQRGLDVQDFVHGKAKFGMDIRLPDMKFAVIERCPVTFGSVRSYNHEEVSSMPGVREVYVMDRVEKAFGPLGGVVIVADHTWAAISAKRALKIEWDYGSNKIYDSEEYKRQLIQSVTNPGKELKRVGEIEKAFREADKTLEASYYLPHLSHAPMEVPCATVSVTADRCEVWAPTQDPQPARREVAEYLDFNIEQVDINVTFLGGGFGRKSKPDFIVEAVAISKKINAPVQVVWTREDDIRHDYFHTVNAQHIKGALDESGNVTAWQHRTAFPSISSTFTPGTDYAASWEVGQGVTRNAFTIPNVLCENGRAPAHVRIGWLRSVNDLPHAFGLNVFADELADAAGKDRLKFFLSLIGEDREQDMGNPYPFYSARLKHVLKTAAHNAGWGKELPKGHGFGLAAHYSFLSYVAAVAQVSVIDNKMKVEKVHIVIDCGTAVNKDAIANQMEGSVIFGLSAVMHGNITAKNGQIQQSNFHNYRMARMVDSPQIHVEIIDNDHPPTGVGEPGLPVIPPAIVNAVFAATGKRFRELPLSDLV
jgi:isoquinoline 1-oxidoreductase subunit beta